VRPYGSGAIIPSRTLIYLMVMSDVPQHELTGLLQAWRSGDRAALDRLVSVVYPELHRIAHLCLTRQREGQSLQTSALVNETYLRLIDTSRVDWRDRAHFFAIAATIMRRVLIQNARVRHAGRRGGAAVRVEFSEVAIPSPERDPDWIALDDALNDLAKADPQEARIVEMRFFGGLNEAETAHVLGVSDRTIRREWDHAKVWLLRALRRGVPA
jgi:RNA polymerase sigma-70 factor (ECF subfamily)